MKQPIVLPLSTYGWTYWLPMLIGGGALSMTLWFYSVVAAAVAAFVTLALLAFFRDPRRRVPAEPGAMVAPADGTITDVTVLPNHEILGVDALRIGIFLSVLDVHINRAPCDGTVIATRFQDGLFLDARHPECGSRNQSNTIVMALAGGPPGAPALVLRQVVGAIARRIICPLAPGDRVAAGQRIGMIAFGSRTELIVPHPAMWEPAVKPGRHVRGGVDILLRRAPARTE